MKTLEQIRDELLRLNVKKEIEYANGVLDMYNETKKRGKSGRKAKE